MGGVGVGVGSGWTSCHALGIFVGWSVYVCRRCIWDMWC